MVVSDCHELELMVCSIHRVSPLSEEQYARLAESTMEGLHDSLEELVEGEQGGEGGWEVEYSVSPP